MDASTLAVQDVVLGPGRVTPSLYKLQMLGGIAPSLLAVEATDLGAATNAHLRPPFLANTPLQDTAVGHLPRLPEVARPCPTVPPVHAEPHRWIWRARRMHDHAAARSLTVAAE